MQKVIYQQLERFMIDRMTDSAHDCQHIYRVLYSALNIAKEYQIDQDVLIAACLLHDIGRDAQFENQQVDHAQAGAIMAYDYLKTICWPEAKALHVKDCIATHRFRNNHPPVSLEAKILFDADKLDVTGTIGIARTLAYQGIMTMPLYSVDKYGNVLNGESDQEPSFFHEYHWKLKHVYDKFYTDRARQIAEGRRQISTDFYENMLQEVRLTQQIGLKLLDEIMPV